MSDERNVKAAHITLFVLGAAQSGSEMLSHYRFMPDQTLMPREDAARLLADLPKPQHCTAAQKGNVLEITCTRIISDSDAARYRGQIERFNSGSSTFGHVVRELDGGRQLKILSPGGDALYSNASGIRSWQEQYVISATYSIAVYNDAELEESTNVGFVIQVSPGLSRAFTSDLPAELILESEHPPEE